MILLNPGPVCLSQGVRTALTRTDLCHREPEFAALQTSVRDGLLDVYGLGSDWATVLVAGSGTAAVEAMLTSLVGPGDRVLVIENGIYGERITEIATIHGIDHARLHLPWGAPVTADAVERILADDHAITHVAIVHHETTTGRLNELASIADVCARHDAALLVDTVSSFGAEDIAFASPAMTACAATANKCLHGAPGISAVLVRRAALRPRIARSLYLDLARHCEKQDAGSTAFTQPVHLLYALDQALVELKAAGGWRQRQRDYQRLAQRASAGLAALGVRPLLATGEGSVVLTAFELPEGLDYAHLHDGLKERGFVIYEGQGDLAPRIFRISTMGAITDADVERLLDAIEHVMAETRVG